MSIIIKEVSSRDDLKKFVDLPYKLYKNNNFWIPPMRGDEQKSYDPLKNPVLGICRHKYWIALKNGKCVGRIAGLIIPLWNEKTGEKLARFTRPEFIDDEEVANGLLSTVEQWAKAENMDGIVGPLGFTNLDQSGLLIEGHDWLPSIASSYHFAYYQKHYDRLGYQKEMDWLEFRITFPTELPEKSYKVANLLKTRYGLRSLNFTTKEELLPYKEQMAMLYNTSFSGLYGTYNLSKEIVLFYFDKYFPILNPRYVKLIVDSEEKIAGFIIALPSLSKAMKKANGSLLPFGFWHIAKALKKPVEIDLMLTGVRPELQKMGLVSLLMNDLWATANSDGVREVETTGMLENNHVAIQMWKSFEHIQHKRKRCYRKMF